MKALYSSGGDKSHKISEQLLSFSIIQIRSRCHYYDVNLTPNVLLGSQKMRKHVTMVFARNEPTDDIYTETKVDYYYILIKILFKNFVHKQ